MEIDDFCTAIRSKTTPLLEAADALLNARVLDRVAAAAVG
jgi:hypothetical protein